MADGPQTIGEISDLVRSKNAGPFWQTLDIFFGSEAAYERAATSSGLNAAAIAQAYRVEVENVRIFPMRDLRAIKISFPRRSVQGSFDDRDIHAGQQHLPLAALPLEPFPE
jgi:hypothetical protein